VLYKVNVPLCREHLFWIVDLQRQFLTKICDATVTPNVVTADWIVSQIPDIGEEWLRAFCKSKDKIESVKRSVISHMQVIAGAEPSVKQAVLDSFNHDVQLLIEIEQGNANDHSLHGLKHIASNVVAEAVRGLLETFYNPQFYTRPGKESGYTIVQGDATTRFHKDFYLSQFDAENPDVAVCPLCDGSRLGAQVDHIYPKSLYPFLSCHPLNLVPICFRCNKIGAKGNNPPLNPDDPNPMEYWFHPYLQPLLDWAQLEQHPETQVFSIQFFQADDETAPHLTSQEQVIIERLKNLDNLVKLTREWKQVLSQTIREQQRNIRRLKHKEAPYVDDTMLKDKLTEWAEDRRRGIGFDPYAILRSYYYAAVREDSNLFDELWVYYNQPA
jgi:hypothetical protein